MSVDFNDDYFGHLYTIDNYIWISSMHDLICIDIQGEIVWRLDGIAVDGICINDFDGKYLSIDCELDPPDGWISNNKLVVYSLNVSPRLAWIVNVSGKDSENGAIEEEIIVDAISGKIIINYSTIIEEDTEFEKRTINNMVEVEGKGYLDNTTKKFEANMVITQIKIPDGSGGRYFTQEAKYQLIDTTRKIQILEYDKNTNSSYLVENTDGKFINEIDYGAAVDAYINIRKTYDYYLNTLDRVSFNNNGVPFTITAEVNFRQKPEEPLDNASFWSGTKHLYFGEAIYGKNSYSTPLDTVAHEYTHAVTYYTAKFDYLGVPGAINEAYADILGELVEGKLTWL